MPDAVSTLLNWEAVAVLLSVAYLLLVIRQNVLCWAAAIVSCCIYIVVLSRAGLYMESALQVFYIGMAVYGWLSWRASHSHPAAVVRSWPPIFHIVLIVLIVAGSGISGLWLSRNTDAVFPYLDSFTTWGAIVATWMVARKIYQNWHYWFVIDAVSVYLFISRELYLTAALFVLYLVLIIVGMRQWRVSLLAQR